MHITIILQKWGGLVVKELIFILGVQRSIFIKNMGCVVNMCKLTKCFLSNLLGTLKRLPNNLN
jgi:hypothetical protein